MADKLAVCPAVLALAAGCLASTLALSQDKPEAAAVEGIPACLEARDRIQEERSALESERTRLESARLDMTMLYSIQDALAADVNRSSMSAVSRFNKSMAQLNELTQQLNDRAARLRAKATEINHRVVDANQLCARARSTAEEHRELLLERVRRAIAH
jgi:chromosome segregation ATPase